MAQLAVNHAARRLFARNVTSNSSQASMLSSTRHISTRQSIHQRQTTQSASHIGSSTPSSNQRAAKIGSASTSNLWRQKSLQKQPIPSQAQKRAFSATRSRRRDHHFDTLKFVQRLRDEGFTEEQSVAVMKVLSDVIEESILNLTRTMVLREDQEKATYTQKVDFAKLRSELLTADNADSSLTRASHDRLTNEISKLNTRLRDEVQRTLASVRLDLNLEKGRIREEVNVQDMKIMETQTRIEQEVAVLKERLETVKFQTLQWLVGVCTGTAALLLAGWRLFM